MGEAIGRPLAAGNVAEVFELGGRVVKLYRRPEAKPAAFREAAVHAAVEAMGLPVPAVRGTRGFGRRWGVVFDRVDGASFADRMRGDPAVVPGHLEALVRLQAKLHEHPADQLRAAGLPADPRLGAGSRSADRRLTVGLIRAQRSLERGHDNGER